MATESAPEKGSRGIQSVEVGGQLLLALAHHGRPMALKDLAREAGMAPAKAHPYLVSFGKLGLIAQEPGNGRYGLGPLAMQLGLISLQQYDPLKLATPVVDELAQTLGHTVAIAVWGGRGPTIVRVVEGPTPVHISMRHGTVMSLKGTASGWLFAAYKPRAEVEAVLTAEGARADDADFESQLEQVRQRGLARAVGLSVPGVSAMAAPVFDAHGTIVLSITAIGASPVFDSAWTGTVARALLRSSTELSRRLGAPAR